MLGAFGQVDLSLAGERGHLDLPAQRRSDHADRRGAMQVVAVTFEDFVLLDADLDVQIAGWPAIRAGLAIAGRADAHALVDPGRNLDFECLGLLDAALAAAGGARLGNDLASAAAGRAGLLDAEEALTHRDRTRTIAAAAHLGAGPWLGTAALAGFAALVGWNADLRVLASGSFFQRDLHLVGQITAAEHLLATTAAALATAATEDVPEDVAEGLGEATHIVATRAETASHVRVDARMAVLVVGGALLRVGEHLVGLLGLLELLFRLLRVVPLVAVRVVLHRQLAIGLLDVFIGGVLRHAQNFVVIALCHRFIRHAAASGSNKNAASGLRLRTGTLTRRGHRVTPVPVCHRVRVTSSL